MTVRPEVPAQGWVVGEDLVHREVPLTRASLIDYAAASGDHNPIHWNDRFAQEVGLGGVIAHGMLTLGVAAATLTDWLGDPGLLRALEARFSRPVPVPDPGAAVLDVRATLGALEDAVDGRHDARVDLTVTFEGRTVLAKARATVSLPAAR